jgi:hypothetical protein
MKVLYWDHARLQAWEDEMCFGLCLYGCALGRADIVPLLGDAVELMHAVEQPPTHLMISARGFGKQPLHYHLAWKRLQKAPVDDVRLASVRSFIHGWFSQLRDWTIYCDVYPESAEYQLGASLPAVPDAEQRLLTHVRHAVSRIQPTYGIGFLRTRGRGPTMYGIGSAYGDSAYSGPLYDEDVAITRWALEGDDALERGMLRDVYPYQLLTERQLSRDIAGQPLAAWIRADPARGRLEAWDERITLWTVDHAAVAEVRRQLVPTGVLLCPTPDGVVAGVLQ